MDFLRHTADMEARLGLRKFFIFALAILLGSNAMLAMALIAKDNNHRQTIVPAFVSKEFWVDDSNVSGTYLEQMGQFVLNYALNNTPQNVDYNVTMLLQYVSPSTFGEIERSLRANASRLKANNASTGFHLTGVQVDTSTKSAVFSGILSTWIGDRRTSHVPKVYLVRFAYSRGKTYIVDVRETTPKEPLKEVAQPEDNPPT